MSEPRWREADSPHPRDGRAPGAPDRYQGAPRDTGPRDQRAARPTGPRFTPNPQAGRDDALATRRMQAPPELRGRAPDRVDPPRGRGHRPGPGGPGRTGRRPSTLAGSFGRSPAAAGIAIVAASAVLGALITIVQGRDPGTVLGVCVVLGTLAAGLAVRPRSAYVLLPVPALSYVVAAFIAGKIHDPASTSRIDQLVHAGTWVADGFVSMVAATIVALVVFGMRLFLDSRGNPRPRRAGGTPPARPGRSGPPRPAADDGAGRPRTGPMPQYRPEGPAYGTSGPYPYGGTGPIAPPAPGPLPPPGTGPLPPNGAGPLPPNGAGPPGGAGPSSGQRTGGHRYPAGPGYEPGPYGADRPPLPDPYRRELPPGRLSARPRRPGGDSWD